jgi:hypothetical protein
MLGELLEVSVSRRLSRRDGTLLSHCTRVTKTSVRVGARATTSRTAIPASTNLDTNVSVRRSVVLGDTDKWVRSTTVASAKGPRVMPTCCTRSASATVSCGPFPPQR